MLLKALRPVAAEFGLRLVCLLLLPAAFYLGTFVLHFHFLPHTVRARRHGPALERRGATLRTPRRAPPNPCLSARARVTSSTRSTSSA